MAELRHASLRDTAGVLADVLVPLAARGLIARRPRVVGLLDRADADRRAVRRLQRLRRRHGRGPVLVRLPRRTLAVVLAPEHVARVLDGSPEPFTPANLEKRAALSRFEPHGVLISRGAARADRRRFNELVLDSAQPVHRLGDALVAKVAAEADELRRVVERTGLLSWDAFATAWWRTVRRIVLGDAARDDHAVTDRLARLRADANWAYLAPRRASLRERFLADLTVYVERAEPGSLAACVASAPSSSVTFPVEQMPQWLFAFDAAGMAAYRALALLAAHPEHAARARAEIAGDGGVAPRELPFVRACVLESLRLWPTTPGLLRDSTAETTWEAGTLAAGAALLIFAPFFHRDDERLVFADAFAPDLWLDGRAEERWPLVSFSRGPGECPGRNVVLLTTSALLARLLAGPPLRQAPPVLLRPPEPLPRTLSPFRLRFAVADRP